MQNGSIFCVRKKTDCAEVIFLVATSQESKMRALSQFATPEWPHSFLALALLAFPLVFLFIYHQI